MAKRVYKSEAQAEAAKAKAARFVDDFLDDPERAGDIASMSLDEWLEETGRRIINPISKTRRNSKMGRKSAKEYAADIRALKAERDDLLEENENLNSLLDEVQSLTEPEDDDGELDDDDDDDDD